MLISHIINAYNHCYIVTISIYYWDISSPFVIHCARLLCRARLFHSIERAKQWADWRDNRTIFLKFALSTNKFATHIVERQNSKNSRRYIKSRPNARDSFYSRLLRLRSQTLFYFCFNKLSTRNLRTFSSAHNTILVCLGVQNVI